MLHCPDRHIRFYGDWTMDYLEEYYNSYDEEGRLLSRHGQVEYLTTMRYIEECLEGISDPDILEVGAGTGRWQRKDLKLLRSSS